MGSLVKARIAILGTRPIWFHHFGSGVLGDAGGGRKVKEGSPGNSPNEWRQSYLAGPDGHLYVEPTYVFGTIRNGAAYTKRGKASIQKTVSATLQIADDRVWIDRFMPAEPLPTDPSEPVYLDIRMVRNPATRAANVRYRVAAAPGWKAVFTITWDQTLVGTNEMQAVLNDAGTLCGIGDGRAIGMGRFIVESFEVDQGLADAA